MNIKFSIHGPMKSGIGEQSIRTYKKIVGKSGTWLISIQDNEADNIYFASNSGKRSDGFGGATLEFVLENGQIEEVQGPWHSNSDSLYSDTGYDVRDKHLTRGIIAKDIKRGPNWEDEYIDVLHYDEVPVIGKYKRIEDLAQELANEHNCRVYYAMKSSGGGNAFQKNPQ